jgi:3-methyl-2-oxobutanoate hydroxymethyltransferase
MNITPTDIKRKKMQGQKITMLTAYDYSMAKMIDNCGIDMILVGDSLGMVALGYDSTVPVTMEEMLHHCRAVSRAVGNAMVIGDMPFMSYHVSCEDAVRNAGRFLKEGGCHAVKLEGGSVMADVIRRLADIGVPVMGHIGLTPQTAVSLGGYKVQGEDNETARRLLMDAEAVEKAGAFSLVLECVPSGLAAEITNRLSIPVIGIGAGPFCDGQVLVTNDMVGMFDKFTPKFVRKYADLAPVISKAIREFAEDVQTADFPSEEESFTGGSSAS